MNSATLVNPKQLADNIPAITLRIIKYWYDKNLDSFREQCAVKIGRRLYFDAHAVDTWLEAHRETAKAKQP